MYALYIVFLFVRDLSESKLAGGERVRISKLEFKMTTSFQATRVNNNLTKKKKNILK